jgi:hypothetical protein
MVFLTGRIHQEHVYGHKAKQLVWQAESTHNRSHSQVRPAFKKAFLTVLGLHSLSKLRTDRINHVKPVHLNVRSS